MGNARKVYVRTFGCQMNVYDSERMTEALSAQGYAETETLDEADLVILNTCHIREKAAEKVYSDLGRIRQVKDARAEVGSDTVVAVVGCVAQAEGAEIVRRAPTVDLVVGPQSYHRLGELIARTRAENRSLVETQFPEEEKFNHLPQRTPSRGVTAFLTVQEGCDKFCTFCVVPYTRGMEYSRAVVEVEKEARALVAGGVREVTLLGQNVNGYHGEGPDGRTYSLADLVRHLSGIEGLERLRYTTSHPRDMDDDLIAAHGNEPKLMPYLHLPFQSGADRILAAMNRKHTAAEYSALVARIRAAQPDLALSTDIIVGFPGETDAEFQATLDLYSQIGFAAAYSFKYSPRPGTPAEKMDQQVPEDVKAERLARLQKLVEQQQQAFAAGCVGRTLPVLFERPGRRPGQLIGRSPYLQSVYAEAPAEMLGRIVPVEISGFGPNSLNGVIRPE
ncbi:tRNA (N6-isopentenyl adenosine(37)-C2)-methylthiotransferase MiaB [Hyphomicrobium sulfonivorans]|uniref:tRNA (N6-isopentenyl adenosine(37)-C2)-methylthiotransferase MiaB n=1 Tax=Hyphomicrobium sulfonivorans TaxID=121290 RepID=UPI00156DD92A|nr:tRNA (N6-isopentenyl adenosine(37)-C2)-methylthiotransferase MiaB [Hyphomicrobium sulfonivorans]MBI1651273.1 tRNA (N6-isopentenyl adenosine(37)-C2)-methylthiotransferase MiaB [Hyphomicrobium sulfonivorans]NSL73240.1 tRNA (N6-isopentenyl adenosine(37)-C2)-methylthiotransferase MiaB [Hyphomicrobium sulfonivorans]